MNVFAFILAIIAAVLFAVQWYFGFEGTSGSGVRVRGNLVPLGLAVLTVALIIQFCAHSHGVTF